MWAALLAKAKRKVVEKVAEKALEKVAERSGGRWKLHLLAAAVGFVVMLVLAAALGVGVPPAAAGCAKPAGSSGPAPTASGPAIRPAGADDGTFTQREWAVDLLSRMGFPDTPDNRRFIVAWETTEGGHFANTAYFNPLNTSQDMPGAEKFNSHGVKVYPDYETGMAATVKTLNYSDYDGIRAALALGNDGPGAVQAVGDTPWGTSAERLMEQYNDTSIDGSAPAQTPTGQAQRAAGCVAGTGGRNVTGNGTGGACPVPNGDVANNWGDSRGGGSRSHQGNDIFGDIGWDVAAVLDGTISAIEDSEVGNAGIAIWLRDDAGNVYFYAHNSDNNGMQLGQRVSRGDVIAHVGDTGNARGGASHVHWQYHPGDGAPVDPWPLLRDWGCTANSSDPRGG